MTAKRFSQVTLREISRLAGLSRSTVSLCLRNKSGPGAKTRARVTKIAEQLGYAPDARLNSLMARVRDTKPKDFLPIAWLNTHPEEKVWKSYAFLTPYLEGIKERCGQLGYRVEEIWTGAPNMTMRRVSQLLYRRGIEGIIVSPPASHLRIDMGKLAGVALGAELLVPRLHRVRAESVHNLLLCLKMLRRAGHKRIGVCLSAFIDEASNGVHSGMAFHFIASFPTGTFVSPHFYDPRTHDDAHVEKQVLAWVRREKPKVIVTQDNRMRGWLTRAGFSVPEEVGIAHLAVDDDVLDWAGIVANKREQGRSAAELVISLIQNRQFGVPRMALDTTIHGTWQVGKTLLSGKQ